LKESHGEQGDDGVERNGASDVDEAEADAATACYDDGVHGDVALFVDAADPVREGEALVTGEGPDVSGDGGEIGHVGAEDECDHDG